MPLRGEAFHFLHPSAKNILPLRGEVFCANPYFPGVFEMISRHLRDEWRNTGETIRRNVANWMGQKCKIREYAEVFVERMAA